MHTFKRFQLALKANRQGFDLIFMDAENFGSRKEWSQGSVYASSNKEFSGDVDIELVVFEVRGTGKKVPTIYSFRWEDNRFSISSVGGKNIYRDHFVRINQLDASDGIVFSEIEFKMPSKVDLEALNFEYQAGLELMYWLSKIEDNTLTLDTTLKALELSLSSLKKVELPIAEYNNVWQAAFGLSVVFAEQIRRDYAWKWIFINNSQHVDPGWCLISPDNKLGLSVERLFYKQVLSDEHIRVPEFYKKIESTIRGKKVATDRVYFVELI